MGLGREVCDASVVILLFLGFRLIFPSAPLEVTVIVVGLSSGQNNLSVVAGVFGVWAIKRWGERRSVEAGVREEQEEEEFRTPTPSPRGLDLVRSFDEGGGSEARSSHQSAEEARREKERREVQCPRHGREWAPGHQVLADPSCPCCTGECSLCWLGTAEDGAVSEGPPPLLSDWGDSSDEETRPGWLSGQRVDVESLSDESLDTIFTDGVWTEIGGSERTPSRSGSQR